MEPTNQTATQPVAPPVTPAETTAPADTVSAPEAKPTKAKTAREYAIEAMKAEKAANGTDVSHLNDTVTIPETEWDLDAFIKEDFTGDPIMDKTHKDLPSYKEILNRHVTEDGKKLIANLRADYTRKTQENAMIKRQLEAEREQLRQERAMLLTSETAKANAAKAAIDTSKLDPYVEADMEKLLDAKAAKLLEEQLKPLRQRYEAQVQEQQAQAFIVAHPELNEPAYKAAMIDVLKTKPHLGTEDAFEIAKARVLAERSKAQAEATKVQKNQGRDYLASPGSRNVTTVDSKKKPRSGVDIYRELLKKNQ